MKQRIGWLDICKSIGIYLVVFAHFLQYIDSSGVLFKMIYSFHMPLFFFLAGITINTNTSFKEFLNRKIKYFGKMYLLFGSLFIAKVIFFDGLSFKDIFTYETIFMTCRSVISQLWFFPTLFIAEIIAFLEIKYIYIYIRKRIIVVSMAISLLGWAITLFPIDYPLGLNVAMYVQIYTIIGHLIMEKDSNFYKFGEKHFAIYVVLLIILNLIAIKLKFNIYSYYDLQISNPVYALLVGLIGTFACVNISKILTDYINVEIIGKNTAYIYGLHFFIVGAFARLFGAIKMSIITEVCLSLAISGGIVVTVSYIVEKIKTRLINFD